MYLRPRQLFDKFLVDEQVERVDENGRVIKEFKPSGELFGCVSNINPSEAEKWHGLKHDATHKIVQFWGRRAAVAGDRLIHDDKVWLIREVAQIQQFVIYFVTRRGDLK